MTTDWSLRPAGPHDLGTLAPLEKRIFSGDAWSEETLAAELGSPHTHYVIAFEGAFPGGRVPGRQDVPAGRREAAGYGGLFAPRGSGDADIQTLAVRQECRGRGLGRLLLQALLAEASRRRAARVFLEVRADNPVAQHLYETAGFTRQGIRRHYYQPDDVDAFVLRLELAGAGKGDD
ncbi:MAG TPA: GNAT family N-acetyltransferase [Microbacteriaceae bacterium]|nr:GNAT family N-acetyltransferase [Microbacteriaceae bacterium]